MKKFLILCLLGILALTVAGSQLIREIRQPLPLTAPLTIELKPGSGIRSLATALTEQNAVRHPLLVRLSARFYGYDSRLKAGEYNIKPGMSLLDVLQNIADGKVVLHRLTLAEGLTSAQMLQLIANHPLLSGDISEPAAEGELLPETYSFHKGASRNQIIKNAKQAMKQAVKSAWQNRAENLPLDSSQELVILASIVEKETAVDTERGKVSSVFINRLNKNMLLQTDPTVIYALTMGQRELGRPLKRKDLSVDSPFNTYKYAGLPPAPICNPGLSSLEAAAHPEDTPYLYFVADGKGGHNFARSLNEHNRNVQHWIQKIRHKK